MAQLICSSVMSSKPEDIVQELLTTCDKSHKADQRQYLTHYKRITMSTMMMGSVIDRKSVNIKVETCV